MARFLSNPIGLKTGLALGVCVLALAACSIDDLRNPQSRSTLKGQEQAESRGSLTRGTQVAKPAPAPMSTYQVSGVAGDSEGPVYQQESNTENYQHYDDQPVKITLEAPVSTFSVDVDTVSYSNVRRFLNNGQLPPKDAVRAEEMINYFDYGYAQPTDSDVPFAVTTEVAPTPWNENSYLVQIGIEGYGISDAERPPANLVFLIDVSGSMDDPAKLPLLVNALKMLVQKLDEKDHVAIVVYAGQAGVVLEPTAGDQKQAINAALAQLSAGGSTAGAAAIEMAYALAKQHYQEDGINRVILATDGDFNVGVTDFEALKDIVARQRESGIELTTLGFGGGNYNEALLEQLAAVGNGNAFYIDTLNEARKVLVDELTATLYTIAQDVKIQVEFNPAVVAEYRLIGYENRELKREDFNNDAVDAGDIGAGHTVTAIYEVVLVGSEGTLVDPLRYSDADLTPQGDPDSQEFAFVKIRYKLPGESSSQLIEQPLMKAEFEGKTLENASDDLRFAAAVAAFAQLLRGGEYLNGFDYPDIIQLAQGAKGEDPFGYRAEFIQLLKLAAVTGV